MPIGPTYKKTNQKSPCVRIEMGKLQEPEGTSWNGGIVILQIYNCDKYIIGEISINVKDTKENKTIVKSCNPTFKEAI